MHSNRYQIYYRRQPKERPSQVLFVCVHCNQHEIYSDEFWKIGDKTSNELNGILCVDELILVLHRKYSQLNPTGLDNFMKYQNDQMFAHFHMETRTQKPTIAGAHTHIYTAYI